jgi:hypothetical protein
MADRRKETENLVPEDMPLSEVVRRAAPLLKQEESEEGPPPEEGMSNLTLFEGAKIRKVFHDSEWLFSVVDVVAAIVGLDRPRKYWSDLKSKLVYDEGFTELSEKIGQFMMNIISKETFGIDTGQHKQLKALKTSHQLRDHMTDLELVFTMLGEKSTVAIARATKAYGFKPNAVAAESGGRVAGDARRELERKLGSTIVSRSNFLGGGMRKKNPEQLTQAPSKPSRRP